MITQEKVQEQFVEIGCGSERYALPIHVIREIIRMQEITELTSCKKSYIKGVMNLRGKIVPIFSLAQKLGVNESPYNKMSRIVVVQYGEEIIGMIVDHVYRVTTFYDIQPPPVKPGETQTYGVHGVAKTSTGLVTVIHLDQLLQGID